jgi:trehalose-6-phosphate synthase
VKRRLGEDEVKALYVAADVALIASVREGVNLWAMEYVACQAARRDDSPPGVLVYSEFAGCASSFSGGALIVNPYDAEGAISASRGAAEPSRRRCDSCPSDEAVGCFFLDFEAVSTQASPTLYIML